MKVTKLNRKDRQWEVSNRKKNKHWSKKTNLERRKKDYESENHNPLFMLFTKKLKIQKTCQFLVK